MIKEVTYEEWVKNPIPRMMCVWDNSEEYKVQKMVLYVQSNVSYPIIALQDMRGTNTCVYMHCAEIEEPEMRRMTNQELAWWLRDNNRREYKYVDSISAENIGGIYFEFAYDEDEATALVEEGILIRENGGEWHEPLVEVEK